MLELAAGRHEVMAVEMRDPREEELPDVGDLWLVDPETGRQLRVDTRSAQASRRFRSDAAAPSGPRSPPTLRSLGVDHVVLSTAGDWLRDARDVSCRPIGGARR